MSIDPWLPIGFELPSGKQVGQVLYTAAGWQIVELKAGGRVLLAAETLAAKWVTHGLIGEDDFPSLEFGFQKIVYFSSKSNQILSPVNVAEGPKDKADAVAFALAMKASRDRDTLSGFQDAIYVESINRLLPIYDITERTDDALVLGYWLTGGANISARNFRRLDKTISWLKSDHIRAVVEAAGIDGPDPCNSESTKSEELSANFVRASKRGKSDKDQKKNQIVEEFYLPGRPALSGFFNEHVIDIVRNKERYASLGITDPSSIILHGPPGCGKTFAVEKLVEFLDWPIFEIDASSIASPYIHETSKKVSKIFEEAIESAPSVVVIDEMEAFLADREMGAGHHRLEEVAEFLRRIPEAVKEGVLIIGMTNRIDLIDPAIQRRGRFDHVIKVDYASEEEVAALINSLLIKLPTEQDIDINLLAKKLAGRPLSDVSFVVREGARLAAKSGKNVIDNVSLSMAINLVLNRTPDGKSNYRIGFI